MVLSFELLIFFIANVKATLVPCLIRIQFSDTIGADGGGLDGLVPTLSFVLGNN